ncbi:MAG TPA: hypothetical protein VM052_04950 [Candidatus Limnocylindrales bacterium]|nr:hypothetical protein [Candidatus Limnocylindrales bacterium]
MRRTFVVIVAAVAVILLVGAVAFAASRGGAAPDPASRQVAAPIDNVDVLIRESSPPQVTLRVMAGLPSGCAKQDSHSVSRAGDTITVTVLNRMPAGNPICTMIYGTYELNIDLGSDFRAGATYTVQVNDRTTTFKA